MRRNLFLLLMCMAAVANVFAASRQLKVAGINVDGLPPTMEINYLSIHKTIKLNDNQDDPVARASRLGELISQQTYDLAGLSEDFNYHEYLMSPISTYYNASTFRGKVEQSNVNSVPAYLTQSAKVMTDGLCLLSRKKTKVLSESIVAWNTHNGYDDSSTDNGNDGLIDKGYRYYVVNFEGNLTCDVYILHMDAGSMTEDVAARESQLTQLAQAIINSNTSNPILVIGDTNCRYTRENLKGLFIDVLNATGKYDVHDPWVEQIWEGKYPSYPGEALTVETYGHQKGEVVDKIFYINNTESECRFSNAGYLHDDSFTYADGSEISDHFPVVVNITIEGPDAPEPEPVVIPDAPEAESVSGGNTYYMRNVATGQFLRHGGQYGTQAILGDYGARITLEGSNNKFALKTPSGSKYLRNENGGYWMDQAQNEWTFTQIENNIYALTDAEGKGFAAYVGNATPSPADANPADANQQWEFLTDAQLRHELYYAKSSAPKDATFLMKAAGLWASDNELSSWGAKSGTSATNKSISSNAYSAYKMYNSSSGITSWKTWGMSQTISDVPAGTYRVTYQVLLCNLSGNHTFTINGDIATTGYTSESSPSDDTVLQSFANGEYVNSMTITVTDEGEYANKIVIYVNKSGTSSATAAYYANFNIKCLALEGILDKEVYDRVEHAINDAQQKADDMGLIYNNSAVESLWYNREIIGDGYAEVQQTYKNLAEANLKKQILPCDYTYAIINPSFEIEPDYKNTSYQNIGGGYPLAWSYATSYKTDSGVWPASDEYKYTSNPDGEYIFNTWDYDGTGHRLYQSVTLTPGIYEMTVRVTSDEGNTVYIFAGDYHAGHTMTCDKNSFETVTLNFFVPNAIPMEIGVIGGNTDGSFTSEGGTWYKVDDFRLTRIGDANTITGIEKVTTAIKDATERLQHLPEAYRQDWNLSYYQNLVDNLKLRGDGTAEFYEIYGLLRERLVQYAIDYRQDEPTAEIDMTDAIINNSFEFGNDWGWETTASSDTGVKPNSNDTYAVTNCDGDYLFNTWWQGTPCEQTVTGLPSGKYRLTCQVASDRNAGVYLYVNGEKTLTIINNSNADDDVKKLFQTVSIEFEAVNGTPVTFGVLGSNDDGDHSYTEYGYWWYKVDNFTLTCLGMEEDVIEYTPMGEYDTLILPFDVTDLPENLAVYSINENQIESHEFHIVLGLNPESEIKANVPYIVEYYGPVSAPASVRRRSADSDSESVSDTEAPASAETFTFKGVSNSSLDTYTDATGMLVGSHIEQTAEEGHLVLNHGHEAGSIFLRLNEGENSTVAAHRAYLTLDDSHAQIASAVFNSEQSNIFTTTGINAAEITDDTEVEVYNISGMILRKGVRTAEALDNLAPGMYILRSGEAVRKVIVK